MRTTRPRLAACWHYDRTGRRGRLLAIALSRLLASGVDALAVLGSGHVVGQIDHADIDTARDRYYTVIERRQPGWAATIRAHSQARRS